MTTSDPHTRATGQPHRRWRWALVAAAVVVAIAIAMIAWFVHHNRSAAPSNDCSIVSQLGPEWTAMTQSVAELQTGAGEAKDLIAIADQESAMSDKIRAAQASVSAPDLKLQLGQWADGTALTAKNQRDAANESSDPGQSDRDSVRAATLTYNATAALRKACPSLQLP